MKRLGSLARVLAPLVALLLGACDKPERGAARVDSPGGSAAGTEASSATPTATPVAVRQQDRLGQALVAVASTPPSEAQPCERTCGRLGDCLLDSDDYQAAEAGGLELQCLDLCVHAPKEAAARSAFLACEQRSGCGELIDCARTQWAALDDVRQRPKIEGISSANDPCKEMCRWLYSCIYAQAPPGQGYLPPEIEATIDACSQGCEQAMPADNEHNMQLLRCLQNHCTGGGLDQCWGY